MSHVIVLCSPADSHLGLFDDLKEYPNTTLIYIKYRSVPFFGELLSKVLLGHRVNSVLNVPYKHLWTKCKIDIDDDTILLVTNSALYYLNPSYLHRLKDKGVKLYLMMTDAMDADSFVLNTCKNLIKSNLWGRVYTFDQNDAQKYGFIYSGYHYYSVDKSIISNLHENPSNDVYFVGAIKGGREMLINETYRHLTHEECTCYFDLSAGGKKVERLEGAHYHIGWIKYKDVLNRVLNSKCILEIMQENQTGATLRYFEAVCYNKKLITNNKNITKFPYYNERWMKIFERPEDIDINWLKKEESINYHYSGDFSPVKLIDIIHQEND